MNDESKFEYISDGHGDLLIIIDKYGNRTFSGYFHTLQTVEETLKSFQDVQTALFARTDITVYAVSLVKL